MGAKQSKASAKEKEDTTGRLQQLQFKYNFWPEPIRKEGTTHCTKEHPDTLTGIQEFVGTTQSAGHSFDTMVAAMNVDDAPNGTLFLYGMAKYDGSSADEKRAEIIVLKVNDKDETQALLRYTDYFSCDAKRLVDGTSVSNDEHFNATKLRAELTSAPTDPNDDDRKVRMKNALNELINAWTDSDESALKQRVSKLPWTRKCAGDKLEAVVNKVCTEDCTISMPLQQIVLKAKDLPNQWRARLTGKGPFINFQQTEVSLTLEAYGKYTKMFFCYPSSLSFFLSFFL